MKYINEIRRMQRLAGIINESQLNEIDENMEVFNKILPFFPKFAEQVKRDKPKIGFGHPVNFPGINQARLDMNNIPGLKYDMGGEDLEGMYNPDKNLFEINKPNQWDEERDKELKELGFGGYIAADLSKPHVFPKANGINITNTIAYFFKQAPVVAQTIDNSLNSGGLLNIWDHYFTIESMSDVLSSYKMLYVHPMNIEDVTLDYIESREFDGDDVVVLYKK